MTTPATHALRFRIWQYCQGCEWNATVRDIADALGEDVRRVSTTMWHLGWLGRIRVAEHDEFSANHGSIGTSAVSRFMAPKIVAGLIGMNVTA